MLIRTTEPTHPAKIMPVLFAIFSEKQRHVQFPKHKLDLSPLPALGFRAIRDSAKEKAELSKPTASVKLPKRRRRTDA